MLAHLSQALADRYRVVRAIGTGGMATVLLVEDLRHHRLVALKVLLPELAAGVGAERFLREIRVVAGLDHPHILPIHDSGEVEGLLYYTMPFVEGESLRERLLREAQLPIDDAIRLGREVADALAYAHTHGIVHRDIKPENILLSGGHARVADFGIARALDAAGGQRLTGTGLAVGTPAYMSPEQASGGPIDGRTDIYSLGCVLYEVLAGEAPFAGATPVATLAKQLAGPAPSLQVVRDSVPAWLEQAIERALRRAPADRFARAEEFRDTLAATTSRTVPVVRPGARSGARVTRIVLSGTILAVILAAYFIRASRERDPERAAPPLLAVLPFRPLHAISDSTLIELGLPDAIITRLARITAVGVRPTTAILGYEKSPDPAAAAKELGVDYVVTGTGRGSGERLRIAVQLARVRDGVVMWGQEYDLPRGRLVELQDSVVTEVVRALDLSLSAAERERLYRRYAADPKAWELYQQGRAFLFRQTEEDTRQSIAAFKAALDRDPDYALAQAGLATASAQMRIRFAREEEVERWAEQAQAAARRALALDSSLAEAHEALAAVYRYSEFDWDGTIAQSTRALELNPNLDLPYYYRAAAYVHLGLFELAEADVRRGMERNPRHWAEPRRLLGVSALFQGNPAVARHHPEEVQRLSARPVSDFYLALAYHYAGDRSGAEALLRRLGGSAQAERRAHATLASFLAARGARREADSLVRETAGARYMDHHVAYALGVAEAGLGRWKEAVRWLRQAAETGFPCLPWFRRDPLLAGLRGRPEFQELVELLEPAWRTMERRYQSTASP